MESQERIENEKKGFRWIDLNSTDISEIYRPTPGSDPSSAYVADLSADPLEVYKLVKNSSNQTGRGEIFNKDSSGRNLVIPVTKGPIFEAINELYDPEWGEIEQEEDQMGEAP
tara:strand:+ start:374 stop:712 length:339 start_codon:yes stop_codon:yes gene_type:complete